MKTEETYNVCISLEKAREIYGKNPEVDILLLSTFSKEELEKKELPKSWEELKEIEGCYINDTDCKINYVRSARTTNTYKNLFATEKQAKSALVMAQLSQLMKVYNGDWTAKWDQDLHPKFCISRRNYTIFTDVFYVAYHFLTFPTKELRDEFLKNFEPLIKEYFEL